MVRPGGPARPNRSAPRLTSRPSPPHSIVGPARPSAGGHRQRPLTSTYACSKKPVLRGPLEPGQYTSIRFTERLAEAGAAPSVGSVGDAYDNALAETEIGLFKTELINPGRPWRDGDAVEIATLGWVDWHNHTRLHSACHDLTPVEKEQIHYRQHPALTQALVPTP
jgi:Integrase core domain